MREPLEAGRKARPILLRAGCAPRIIRITGGDQDGVLRGFAIQAGRRR